jgi:hypothetical protein
MRPRGYVGGALEDLGTRLAIARHRLAAELTDNRLLSERAVEAELRDCATYLERLQRRATRDGSADEQSQLAIADLRTRHAEVARHLRAMRTVTDETWQERRERVEAALDEVERAVDRLIAGPVSGGLDGASRTRTGDLLGAISALFWPEFGLTSALPSLPVSPQKPSPTLCSPFSSRTTATIGD